MNGSDSTFRTLMSEVKAGAPDALRCLVETFGPRVLGAIRRRLHRKMRSKFDSADFIQNVWASFFSPKLRPRIDQIKTPDDLIRFLMAMARNKTIEETRRRLDTRKYGVHGEVEAGDVRRVQNQLTALTPTPSQTAIAKETWKTAQEEVQSGMFRVVQMRVEGATFKEIAEQCGIHERTARRIIHRLKRKMKSSSSEPSSGDSSTGDASPS